MRALLVSPSSTPGGSERSFVSLAARLSERGIDVSSVLLQRGPLERWLTQAGCDVDVIDAGRARHVHRTATTVLRLARLASDVDVVVSNQSKGHVYGGLAARLADRPSVWWQRGIPGRSRVDTAAARVRSDIVICSSTAAADAQRRLSDSRIELVHPGVDIARIRERHGSGAAIRRRLGVGDRLLVGIVGRLQEWKGQDVFLRAAARIATTHPDARFVVVGDAILGWEGDYPDRLRALASELSLGGRCRFAGHQDDVYPWFDALDVVVHASRDEPFGRVIVEAMALGKPVVAAAACGPTEIIEHGISGLLVAPGDDERLAAEVGRLLDDADLRRDIGMAAERRAELFDDTVMAERIAGMLTGLVADRRGYRRRLVPSPAETAVRRAMQGFVRYVPPRGRGNRAVRLVDAVLPPRPDRLQRAVMPDGVTITCDLRDHAQSEIFYRGTYEPDVTAMIMAELRTGDVFLDIGANSGYFSLLAATRCGPTGHVHAFEPAHEIAARIEQDASRLGPACARVSVHAVALLDRSADVRLVSPGRNRNTAQQFVEPLREGGSGITATSLDALLPDVRVDVAKIDVEGAELAVIRGASEALRRSRPRLILIEAVDDLLARFGASVPELTSLMDSHGYDLTTTIQAPYRAAMLAFRPRAR